MMHYGPGMGAGWSLIAFATVLPLFFIAAGLIVYWIRREPFEVPATEPTVEAERVLADRFARGDIDTTEYELRLRVLRAQRHPPAGSAPGGPCPDPGRHGADPPAAR